MIDNVLMWMFGAISALALVAGLCFLRFAVTRRDRFFGWFAAAFWLLGSSWTVQLFTGGPEGSPYIYVLRAAAYILIIVAIVDRNRGARSRSTGA